MSEQTVGIIAECMCDLPKKYLRRHNIDVIYFLIRTESGVFTDTDEISTENILEYMETESNLPVSSPPPAEVYEKCFRKNLEKYNEVIFISSGAGASASYGKASEALEHMGNAGGNMYIFDSCHLSSGIGHIIIKAAEMAEAGYRADDIISFLTVLREQVSTSFITMNADYLYRGGHVSKTAKTICDFLGIHPILTMKNGKMTLKSVQFGKYDTASLRYVRKELKNFQNIDKTRIFITHAGCSTEKIEQIINEIKKIFSPENIIVTKASASISCNCGPNTFGVLFIMKGSCKK